MSRRKKQFPYSFFILLSQGHESSAPKLTTFHIPSLPLKVRLFSKSPYLTAHLKTNYEIDSTGRFSEETQRRIQDHHNI